MSVNVAATVLKASSAYNTTMVPLASLVHATATAPQASLINTTATVPEASSVNTDVMAPQASSANALTSMDVDVNNTSTLTIMEADEKATAEIYL